MAFDVRDETIPAILLRIHPKMEYTLGLSRKVQVMEALQVRVLQRMWNEYMLCSRQLRASSFPAPSASVPPSTMAPSRP